jgi:hypothetical protein
MAKDVGRRTDNMQVNKSGVSDFTACRQTVIWKQYSGIVPMIVPGVRL